MALGVEWALPRSSALLVNSLACSKSECLNFNRLGHWSPSQIGSKIVYTLANVTKPHSTTPPQLAAKPSNWLEKSARETRRVEW
jgi:hypothetical protein